MKLKIQVIEKKHERSAFDCGYSMLNDYLKKQARQDVNRDLSACFVLVDEDNVVRGYYTLSANSIRRDDFPDELKKKLPLGYTDLPTTLLGRLAVDNTLKGQGYGEILLMNALNRSLETSESVGALAVVVDPIDEKAQLFYSKYGFIQLPTSGKMFLTMKTIKDLVG
jgi:predicted GNAT family N-acyltransferase